MDKVYMNKKHGISFYAMERDGNFFIRILPIIDHSEENILFKADSANGTVEVKTDYFTYYAFTKSQVKAIQTCMLKAMQDNPGLIRVFRIALKAVFTQITNISFKERTQNQNNIAMLFDTYFFNLIIREV